MTFIIFIRTSFILSGLLGLKLIGYPIGPVSLAALDTTIPLRIIGPKSTLNVNRMGVKDNNYKSNSSGLNQALNDPKKEGYFYPKPMKSFSLPKSSNKALRNLVSKSDSSAECQEREVFVTWLKEDSLQSTDKDIVLRLYNASECFPNDGLYYMKMDPKKAKLCDIGQTHSIKYEPQPCLRDDPPCSLTWKYKCVNDTESSHNCEYRRCPSKSCIEQIRCEDQPPCVIEAICLPSFLVHE